MSTETVTNNMTEEQALERYKQVLESGVDQFDFEDLMPLLFYVGRSRPQLLADQKLFLKRKGDHRKLTIEVPQKKEHHHQANEVLKKCEAAMEAMKERHQQERTAAVAELRAAIDETARARSDWHDTERKAIEALRSTASKKLHDQLKALREGFVPSFNGRSRDKSDDSKRMRSREAIEAAMLEPGNMELTD